MVPDDPKQADRLEFDHYRTIVDGKLAQQGLVPVIEPAKADWRAILGYDVQPVKMVMPVVSGPVFVRPPDLLGWDYPMRAYNGLVLVEPPPWDLPMGVVRQSDLVSTDFTRTVRLTLFGRSKKGGPFDRKPVYEGKVVSVGKCSSLAAVFAPMVDAMFASWPGVSGQTQIIRLPMQEGC